jgi:hypothetical protein
MTCFKVDCIVQHSCLDKKATGHHYFSLLHLLKLIREFQYGNSLINFRSGCSLGRGDSLTPNRDHTIEKTISTWNLSK